MFHHFIHEILSAVEMEKIAEEIKLQEEKTAGEIRVSIKQKRKMFEKKSSLRNLAIKEFFRMKINNTLDRSGILLFLILKDKQFYILPDEGITKVLDQNFWNELSNVTEKYFRNKNFFDGIIHVIRECGKVLSQHFPRKPDDVNELDDRVEVS
ncbi:MAG: hypothetical protein FJ213_10300 [Ignavibacteria bacterium]|nr:hypothetical protein [Ignavibacteria bacterium]